MVGELGMPSVSKRDHRGVGVGVVGRLGCGHALDGALPEFLRRLRDALLDHVGHEGRDDGADAGDQPQEEADAGAAADGAERAAPFLARRQQRRELGLDHLAIGPLDGEQDFGDAEQAHHHGDEADAVVEARDAEGEARRAAHRVDADHARSAARARP